MKLTCAVLYMNKHIVWHTTRKKKKERLQPYMKNHFYTINRRRKERRERKKQTHILHAQATYCTHKQQLHQLRNSLSASVA